MKHRRFDALFIAQLGLLIAIEFVMQLTGLGMIPIGPLKASLITVPVAIGAMLLGPAAGLILGTVFGAISFYSAMTAPSVMMAAFMQISILHSFILCVITRMLMGLLDGIIFKVVHFFDRRGFVSYIIGALAAPLLNTTFFMGYIVLVFYQSEYVQNLVVKLGAANPIAFIFLLVGMQALVEALVCCLVGSVITKALAHILHIDRPPMPPMPPKEA